MGLDITIDVDLVKQFADDLEKTTGSIQSGVSRGVNAIAKVVRDESVVGVYGRVNLQPAYVDKKIKVAQDATPERTVAVIEAEKRGALLSAFGAQQQSVANVWTAAMFAEKFGSLKAEVRPHSKAPKMPWTPRTGDPLRAIAPGAKQAGINVAVRANGALATWAHVFFIPAMRKGQDGSKWVTLSRPKGGGKATAKYGPSVDQVVKNVWSDESESIADRMGESVLDEVSKEITKGLEK